MRQTSGDMRHAAIETDVSRPPCKSTWVGASVTSRGTWAKEMFIPHPDAQQVIADALEKIAICEQTDKSTGMHIVAESGAGKSTIARQIEKIVTAKYGREDPEKTVKPVLCLEAPSPCTPAEMCRHILERLGDVRARTRQSRDPLRSLEQLAAYMMNSCEVRIVLFDNFQDIPSARRARGIEQLGLRLRDMMDMTKCTWMYLGTEESREVISAKSQLIKRVPYTKTINYFDIDQGKKLFIRLLERYDEWIPLAQSSANELKVHAGRIYIATQGVFDRLTGLMDLSWREAVADRREALTLADMSAAFKKLFGSDHENPFDPDFVFRTLDRFSEPYQSFGMSGSARTGASRSDEHSNRRRK